MPRHKTNAKPARSSSTARTAAALHSAAPQPSTVSARWLLAMVGLAFVAAAVCAWGALCLVFWQGSWQLLYHPASAVTRTPSSLGLAFDSVAFATSDTGQPRLNGWWIPAAPDARYSRYTVLYFHGSRGNLADTVDALAALHAVGVNVLAFDYRGYGQSQFARPSEMRWRQDADWALQYLTGTRHVAAGAILLDGTGLGANLALQVGAAHPELGGVVLMEPIEAPANAIFRDPRARMFPAHLLVRDRYDLNAPASALRIPSLWFVQAPGQAGAPSKPQAFQKVTAMKMRVWLAASNPSQEDFANSLSRWLDELHT